MLSRALKSIVTIAKGELAPATNLPATPKTTNAHNMLGHSEQGIPASSVGNVKKRMRDAASSSTSVSTLSVERTTLC
jgi:hypothetical protein